MLTEGKHYVRSSALPPKYTRIFRVLIKILTYAYSHFRQMG